jgi:hypothetical protein
MKASLSVSSMFKNDHPRAVDRVQDYFEDRRPVAAWEGGPPRWVGCPGARRRRAIHRPEGHRRERPHTLVHRVADGS